MKLNCFFILCLFYYGCFCLKAPTVEPLSRNCAVCDSLMFEQSALQIPNRRVDKNLTGVPLVKMEGFENIPDSALVLSSSEARNIYSILFCFLGKKESEIDAYFTNLENSEFPLSFTNKFVKLYYYNMGDYFQNGRIVEVANNANLEFMITHLTKFELIFSKIGNDTLFTGTKGDSTNLMNCRKSTTVK